MFSPPDAARRGGARARLGRLDARDADTGMRNHFDTAFNALGDLFTYDSDMEWDAGTPWYRPTRIYHLVSGGDYGHTCYCGCGCRCCDYCGRYGCCDCG